LRALSSTGFAVLGVLYDLLAQFLVGRLEDDRPVVGLLFLGDPILYEAGSLRTRLLADPMHPPSGKVNSQKFSVGTSGPYPVELQLLV
jgi:hypothetical protein